MTPTNINSTIKDKHTRTEWYLIRHDFECEISWSRDSKSRPIRSFLFVSEAIEDRPSSLIRGGESEKIDVALPLTHHLIWRPRVATMGDRGFVLGRCVSYEA